MVEQTQQACPVRWEGHPAPSNESRGVLEMEPSPSAPAHAGADAAFEAFRGVRTFKSLDGLRAGAILLVLWQHAPAVEGGASWLTDAGATGVALFFALSGFLITTLLLRERDRRGRISLRDFYVRRALRIFPLYYAVLALYGVLVLLREHNAAGRDFFANLPFFATYTSNWFVDLAVNADGQRRVIFVHSWSLAVEEQFYLLWPACLVFLRRRWAVAALVGLMLVDVCVTFWWGKLEVPGGGVERVVKILQSPSTEIGLGVLGAILLHSRGGFGVAWRVLGTTWAAPAVALVVLAAAAWARGATPAWYLVQSFALAALVLACVIREDNGLSRGLRLTPLARLGVISYGVYLLHPLAIDVAELAMRKVGLTPTDALAWLWHPMRLVLTMGIAVASAELSFRVFESRFLRLKERFTRA